MAEVRVTKKDVIWSYVAQFFNMGSGLIVLPMILHMLSPAEIAMNYLMLTVSSLIALLDFGFLPQFSRNITYVFSGVPDLKEEGLFDVQESVNFGLLKNMIGVAKKVYGILSASTLFLMLTLGTLYIHKVTNGFSNVNNALVIWLIFSISSFFNVYYSYYASLLSGKGLVKETKIANIAQRFTYIILSYCLLIAGFSLLGVVIANLISPFVGRYFYHKFFYQEDLKLQLKNYTVNNKEVKRLFRIIWYNSKKMGLITIASFGITKIGMFLSGLYLSSPDVASYGLMIQLMAILTAVSGTHYVSIQPLLGSLYASGKRSELIKQMGLGITTYYIIFISGLCGIILCGPLLLLFIKSNTILPSTIILLLYGLCCFLETNTSFFSAILVLGNKINFVSSSLLTSFGIVILSYLSLRFTDFTIMGLVLSQLIPGLFYSDWKWPYVVCHNNNTNILNVIKVGSFEIKTIIKTYYDRHFAINRQLQKD